MTKLSNFYRGSEAAQILGVSRETVRRWVKEGRLQAIKTLGGHLRFEKSVIENLLDANRSTNVDTKIIPMDDVA